MNLQFIIEKILGDVKKESYSKRAGVLLWDSMAFQAGKRVENFSQVRLLAFSREV